MQMTLHPMYNNSSVRHIPLNNVSELVAQLLGHGWRTGNLHVEPALGSLQAMSGFLFLNPVKIAGMPELETNRHTGQLSSSMVVIRRFNQRQT